MIDPKKAAEMEQQIALTGDMLPRIWASLYRGLLQQNFDHNTSIALLQTYIIALHSDKIFAIPPESKLEKPKEE